MTKTFSGWENTEPNNNSVIGYGNAYVTRLKSNGLADCRTSETFGLICSTPICEREQTISISD